MLVGAKLGVFEALGQNPLTAADAAAKLGTERDATGKLLNALTGLGYLRAAGNGFVLSSEARRWLVTGSPRSLRDWVLEQELLEWRRLEHLEYFVRTGHAVQAHDDLSDKAPGVYQRGMRSVAGLFRGGGGAPRARSHTGPADTGHRRLTRLLLGGHLPPSSRSAVGRPRSSAGDLPRRPAAGPGRNGRPRGTPGRGRHR